MRQPRSTVESSLIDPSNPTAIAVPSSTVSSRVCRSWIDFAIHASEPAIDRFKKYRAASASSRHTVGSCISE